jgi:putative heme-binding domain-containing protein
MRTHAAMAMLWLGGVAAGFGQTNGPVIRFLAPGLAAQELPVKISNINNIRFAPDGRLTALAYDGKVHLLRDSNGDGIEDKAEIYWDKSTLSVPVGMVWAEEGLYVSSHGKVSLLRDSNGSGRADTEEVVASGWPPTDVASGGVDATAVTRDAEGNLYFGLLTADYSNPYRVKDGVSRYSTNSPRGTIQKLSADRKKLETIATGIRVPYTLAFNRARDLFVTDQEGATWCPGGNPLDELDYIIPGRNYGFPPRNAEYLPNLVSEAPVVAFAPQHQSSCGFFFNEATPAQPSFGPKWWEGDAFVAGESRGKIWRVRLVKVPGGYVGREFLVARLSMLTLDVALSPKGDLYVACHSGYPDWGTGPAGEGKIFKITYADPTAPQPVAVWAAGPMETRVAFDKPLAASTPEAATNAAVEFGEFVAAADRFEILKPPYEVVKRQEQAPRGHLRGLAGRLEDEGRTLVLTTEPHPQATRYALTVPGVRAAGSRSPAATVDLAYDLNGLEAEWTAKTGGATWRGWLPHLDMDVNRAFMAESASHARLFADFALAGRLNLRATPRLPGGRGWIRIEGNRPMTLATGGTRTEAKAEAGGYAVEAEIGAAPMEIEIETGGPELAVHAVTWSDEDKTVRPLPLAAFRLPWAPPEPPPFLETNTPPESAPGDYESGRSLFFGDKLRCATCHRIRGEGKTIGPDLTNLSSRDSGSILRDIREPSYSINPDYVAYNVSLKDGGELTGFVRMRDATAAHVIGADGVEKSFPLAEIQELKVSQVSLMPTGLIDPLAPEQVRDLLTFLRGATPVRSAEQIGKALAELGRETNGVAYPGKRIRVTLVASKQDHGPGQHDYPAWQKEWQAWLATGRSVEATNAWEWPDTAQWRDSDVVVYYFWNHQWTPERLAEVDAFQKRGGGLVMLHSAVISDDHPETLAERIGWAAQPVTSKYRHTVFRLNGPAPGRIDPIPASLNGLEWLDEAYWPLVGGESGAKAIATAEIDGKACPQIWTFERGPGRVFASILGHYTWTWRDPLYKVMVLRAIAWAARRPDSGVLDLADGLNARK